MRKTQHDNIFNAAVVVSALGYFVDIYDLLLFGIVRVPSLKTIGVPADQLLSTGVTLINLQMTGMLLGGILWGVLGDKRGRLSVLFGSILLYSIANIANAFVHDVHSYGALRFFAGIGLAGELGAAITLVSETMSKERRGIGTTIVAAFGILGAVVAALIGDWFDWRTAYIVGGCMGLVLLILRLSMYESGMFEHLKALNVRRGEFLKIFTSVSRLVRYLQCILVGVPMWFVIGILVTFSPELAQDLGVVEKISAGKAIMFAYTGLAVGDLASGLLSQALHSRRKAVMYFLSATFFLIVFYVYSAGIISSAFQFYALCVGLGLAAGYWAVFVTIAAEQFGTNIRATVTTTVPNFVRGSVVPMTLSFKALSSSLGTLHAALVVGLVCVAIAFLALRRMPETFGKDLNFVENL